MRAVVVVWLLAGSMGLAAQVSRAYAQEAAGDAESYAKLIHEAVREFDGANYREAHALFERAYAKKPTARTLRGLGFCSYELKHYVRAVHELESALQETRNPLTPEQRNEVSETLQKAQRFVGKLVLDVQPEGASLELDGRPIDANEQVLDAGDYTLTASAPGYRGSEQQLTVEGGQSVVARVRLLQLDLRPEQSASAKSAAPPRTELTANRVDTEPSSSVFSKWWFWTVAGVVVAGAVTGTLLALNSGHETATPNKGTSQVLLQTP